MNVARYVPGPWAVIVTDGGIAVLGGDLPPSVLSHVWDRLGSGGGLGSVLESLTGAFGTSLAAIPPFAVAVTEGSSVRVAVRGEIAVHLSADVDATVSGVGVTTWSERVIPGVTSLEVTLPALAGTATGVSAPAPAAWFPLSGGIVLASALHIEHGATSTPAVSATPVPGAEPTPMPVPVPVPVPAPVPATPAPGAEPTPVPATVPSPAEPEVKTAPAFEAPPLPDISPVAAVVDAVDAPRAAASGVIDSADVLAATDGETWMPMHSTLAHSTQRAPTAQASVEASEAPQSAGEYDEMWGATIARPVDDAPDGVGAESDVPTPRGAALDGAVLDGSVPDGAAPDGAALEGAVLDGAVPDGAESAERAPQRPMDPAPASIAALEGDHDGATISVAQAQALRNSTPAAPPAPTTPAPAPLGAPLHAPPLAGSLGTIHLSTGQTVVLDRTVIIGRRPRSTRVSGTELPHLIAVDSPEQDISRSHVEIRPEGDSVIVVDLHTTNGTTLLRAGAEPVRLHPGEQTVVVSGDVIDLGDGITVTFEDLP